MNVPTTYEALVIVVLIFVPGIIFSQLVRRAIMFYPEQMHGWHFLSFGAVGLFLHTLMFPFGTKWVIDWYVAGTIDKYWFWTFLWFVFTIFLWPVLTGIGTSVVVRYQWVDDQLDKVGMGRADRTPSAWDWAVDLHESRWIKVHLRDGTVIGGFYATESLAAVYSSQKDIYLEQMWLIGPEGEFSHIVASSDGVWIGHEMISHIVLLMGED